MNNIKYNIMRGKLQHFFFLYAAVFFLSVRCIFLSSRCLVFCSTYYSSQYQTFIIESETHVENENKCCFFFVDGCNFRRCARFIVRKIMWNRGVNKENGNVFTFR